MAISNVRVQLDGVWYELIYNSVSRAYEAEIVPTASSYHQPGGYFNITAEATNDTGVAAVTDGGNIPGLRLVVKDASAPVISLLSSAQGYLTTKTPSVVLTVTDKDPGVDISSVSASFVCGVQSWNALVGTAIVGVSTMGPSREIAADVSVEEIDGGYRIICTPTEPLSEGTCTLYITVQDYDGNVSELALTYIVDTVPPSLSARIKDGRRIVDVERVALNGRTNDATAPPVVLMAENNGIDLGMIPVGADGRFSFDLFPSIGDNHIVVTATDGAGLTTSVALYLIRLITDRTQADADRVVALRGKGWSAMSADEQAEWLEGMRGAYNARDYNRVVAAVELLERLLDERGFFIPYTPVELEPGRTEWLRTDIPTPESTDGYLENVSRIRDSLPLPDSPEVPEDWERPTFGEANDIEKILVMADALIPRMERSYWYSGEIYCGEV